MLSTILAFFGYVKVPIEAVQITMILEDDFRNFIEICEHLDETMEISQLRKTILLYKRLVPHVKERIKAIHILQELLRAGRMLNRNA